MLFINPATNEKRACSDMERAYYKTSCPSNNMNYACRTFDESGCTTGDLRVWWEEAVKGNTRAWGITGKDYTTNFDSWMTYWGEHWSKNLRVQHQFTSSDGPCERYNDRTRTGNRGIMWGFGRKDTDCQTGAGCDCTNEYGVRVLCPNDSNYGLHKGEFGRRIHYGTEEGQKILQQDMEIHQKLIKNLSSIE
jgi:hypothetical protein